MFRKMFIFVCVLSLACTAVSADLFNSLDAVEFTFDPDDINVPGCTADFDASASTQLISGGGFAFVWANGEEQALPYSVNEVIFNFGGMSYDAGADQYNYTSETTWSITLSSVVNPVPIEFTLAGHVDWYRETIMDTDSVSGSGVLQLDTFELVYDSIIQVGWTFNAEGDAAFLSTIDNITNDNTTVTGVDYAGGWESNNTTIWIHSDSSMAVPEPATVALLGLGSLSLIRMRKRR